MKLENGNNCPPPPHAMLIDMCRGGSLK